MLHLFITCISSSSSGSDFDKTETYGQSNFLL